MPNKVPSTLKKPPIGQSSVMQPRISGQKSTISAFHSKKVEEYIDPERLKLFQKYVKVSKIQNDKDTHDYGSKP